MTDNIHQGHRQRMRAKLYTHGDRIFDTYELLEMLLYYVIPYKDTNPIAKSLLFSFASLDGVFKAKAEELVTVDGIGERAATFLHTLGVMGDTRRSSAFASGKEKYSSADAVGKLCVDYFRGETDYATAYFFFDAEMRLIAKEEGPKVDYSSAALKASEVVNLALSNKACIVVSAHLHPHGPLFATVGDMATNEHIRAGLESVGVCLAQHYLVSGENYKMLMSENEGMFRQDTTVVEFLTSRNSYERSFFGKIKEPSIRADAILLAEALSFFVPESELLDTVCRINEKYPSLDLLMTKEIDVIERECRVNRRVATFCRLAAYITARRKTDRYTFGKTHTESETKDFLRWLFFTRSNEALFMLALDKKRRVMSCEFVSEGTVNASEVTPRRLIEIALKSGCHEMILAHNHPQGVAEPSFDDIAATAKIKLALDEAAIKLVAHYIVADNGVRDILSSDF